MKNISAILLVITLLLVGWKISETKETSIKTNDPTTFFPLLDQFNTKAEFYDVRNVDSYLASNLTEVVFVNHNVLNHRDSIGTGEEIYDAINKDVIGRFQHLKIESGIRDHYIYKSRILLSEKLKGMPYATRHVLWHEIGHMVGLNHNSLSEADADPFYIMNEHFPLWYFEKGYGIPDRKWREYSSKLFDKIRGSDRSLWRKRYYGLSY